MMELPKAWVLLAAHIAEDVTNLDDRLALLEALETLATAADLTKRGRFAATSARRSGSGTGASSSSMS